MESVKSHAQDMSMSVENTTEAPPEYSGLSQDRNDIERESLSQPLVNLLADVVSSQEYSHAPASGATATLSQQPSPEFLMSLGVKVRDFAYESTLPAIVPVPRVPRQVQPTPRPLKRLQRDWDDKESSFNGSSPVRPLSGQSAPKKPRSLERRPTEPLQEPVVQHTRTLERITVKRVCSILTPSSRSTLPTTPRARFSASPPTSPLTPLSRFASQELVQTSPAFPFVVHVNDTSTAPALQIDSDPQPLSLRPVLFTRLALESRPSPGCSPAPSPPQNASPAPLISSFLELPSPAKQPGADPRVRKRRGCGTPPPSKRYQLRQRPISSSHASAISRCSHQTSSTSNSLPRRTRRVR